MCCSWLLPQDGAVRFELPEKLVDLVTKFISVVIRSDSKVYSDTTVLLTSSHKELLSTKLTVRKILTKDCIFHRCIMEFSQKQYPALISVKDGSIFKLF